MFDEIAEKVTKKLLEVVEVSGKEFEVLKKKYSGKGAETVQGYWEEADGPQPILNEGVSECAAFLRRNRKSGGSIHGHFPDVNADRTRQKDREIINHAVEIYREAPGEKDVRLPTERKQNILSIIEFDPWYENYRKMLSRVGEWVKESGSSSVEIYLFGQNPPEILPDESDQAGIMVRTLKIQNAVNADLLALGIPMANVCDKRRADRARVEDILFLPEGKSDLPGRRERKIIHSARREESPMLGL